MTFRFYVPQREGNVGTFLNELLCFEINELNLHFVLRIDLNICLNYLN